MSNTAHTPPTPPTGRAPFEPTHLLPIITTTQNVVGASIRTRRTTILLPIQLTGWHGFNSCDRVEYLIADGGYWESKWCNKSELLPLPNIVTTVPELLD